MSTTGRSSANGIADFGAGAQIGLKQLLLQRMQAQQYADRMKQQAFENERQLSGDRRADRQMDETSALRKAAQDDLAQQRTFGEANAWRIRSPATRSSATRIPPWRRCSRAGAVRSCRRRLKSSRWDRSSKGRCKAG
jgi:hypothetical protein